MKTLLSLILLSAGCALAQNPAITINQTPVNGPNLVPGDCLYITTTKKVGQKVCGGGGGSGTVTQINTTAPIQGGPITTTGTITCRTATGAVSGCLSAADFTTFNGKQAAGNYITALTNDVTAAGPGSAAATIANGAVTAVKMVNAGVFTGDVTTTFPAVTVAKVNGIAYSATAAAHTVPVTTTANTTSTYKVVPDCTDTGGNHLNFTQSTDAFSCGTSGGGGLVVGTTAITSGSTTKVLFDNAGVLGEYTISGSVNVCMTTSCVMTTPNIGTPSAGTLTNVTGLPLTGLVNAPSVRDTQANIAATSCNSAHTGVMGFTTDSVYEAQCNGSSWQWFLPTLGAVTLPGVCADYNNNFNVAANWTCTNTNGTIFVDQVQNATTQLRGIYKSTPSTPWTKTMCYRTVYPQTNGTNTLGWGMLLTDGTKAMLLGITTGGTGIGTPIVTKWTNSTTFSTNAGGLSAMNTMGPTANSYGCAQISDDGSTLTFKWSPDGITFLSVFSEAVATFLTPSGYGFGGNMRATGTDAYASVVGYN